MTNNGKSDRYFIVKFGGEERHVVRRFPGLALSS
jgi:hypothetical protein